MNNWIFEEDENVISKKNISEWIGDNTSLLTENDYKKIMEEVNKEKFETKTEVRDWLKNSCYYFKDFESYSRWEYASPASLKRLLEKTLQYSTELKISTKEILLYENVIELDNAKYFRVPIVL